MDYGLTAAVVGAFTLLFSIILFYLAGRVNRASVGFLSVGFFFLGLTLLTIPVLIIDTIEYGSEPPCEWVENRTNTTYRYGWNYSGYHWDYGVETAPDGPQTENADFMRVFHEYEDRNYFNTCASRAVPGTITAVFTIFTWLVWAALFAGLLAAIIYFIRSWVKKV